MNDMEDFEIVWVDSGIEPKCQPNPNYPKGIAIDQSRGSKKTCTVKLPYPARRCGVYFVTCNKCGYEGGCTTAGRPDDPTSITIPCKKTKKQK